MSKEAIEHYEAALKEAFPSGATGDVFYHWNEARKELAEQPAPMIRGDIRDGLVDDEPAQSSKPFDTHAAPGQSFDTHSRTPQQEPVGKKTRIGLVTSAGWDSLPVGTEFYTSPQAQPAQRTWQGLMDEEIAEQDWRLSADRTYEQWTLQEQLVVCGVKDFARAIEAKLKEKNT